LISENLQGNLQELIKKIFQIGFFVLLLFAGFIVMTQEMDDVIAEQKNENGSEEGELIAGESGEESEDFQPAREIPEWVKPARWFRSNAGGMALEEIPSRVAALRNEYALVIDFTESEELPEYLIPHFDNSFFIETRALFEKGKETRKQWIFRDANGNTRLTAVFIEPENEGADENNENAEVAIYEEHQDIVDNANEDLADNIAADSGGLNESVVSENAELGESETLAEDKNADSKNDPKKGFIEIYDENNMLASDYRFSDDGTKDKIEYYYKNGAVIRAVSLSWNENEEGGNYRETHTDYFYYNRSSFLRAMERVFSKDQEISTSRDPVRISFPVNILAAAKSELFIGEKQNAYPEFFGDLFVTKDSRLKYTTDERGRILTQTLYSGEKDDDIIWVIKSMWSGDNIASMVKTEGDVELTAEYEYDSSGDRVVERNIRNGVLERLVKTEGKKDIEVLYLNNVAVMQAVWEDGRKISETRIKKN